MSGNVWEVWHRLKSRESEQDDDGVPGHRPNYRFGRPPGPFGAEEGMGRVQRVRAALDKSRDEAMARLLASLKGIELAGILRTLVDAAIEMATILGGSAIIGFVLGGVAGSFAGGVGAAPGAAVGAAVGGQIGVWVLGFLGLKSLIEDLGDALPKAFTCYREGFTKAWGPTRWESHQPCQDDWHLVTGASRHFADGHVILLTALLAAMAAYLTRGKGDRGVLLQEIRQSRRLGPRVADWVVANEEKLRNHPALKVKERPAASAMVHEKPLPEPETPSRARGRVEEARKPEKPKEESKGKGPCDHFKRGTGGGKYRGGAHGEMSKPTNDGKDSHHMPPDDVSPLPTKDGAAIQMDPPDHRETSSNGNNGRAGAAYRGMIKQLLENGEWRKAMAIEIKDVREIARAAGDPKKYNAAIREMMAYFDCMQKHGLLK